METLICIAAAVFFFLLSMICDWVFYKDWFRAERALRLGAEYSPYVSMIFICLAGYFYIFQ